MTGHHFRCRGEAIDRSLVSVANRAEAKQPEHCLVTIASVDFRLLFVDVVRRYPSVAPLWLLQFSVAVPVGKNVSARYLGQLNSR